MQNATLLSWLSAPARIVACVNAPARVDCTGADLDALPVQFAVGGLFAIVMWTLGLHKKPEVTKEQVG